MATQRKRVKVVDPVETMREEWDAYIGYFRDEIPQGGMDNILDEVLDLLVKRRAELQRAQYSEQSAIIAKSGALVRDGDIWSLKPGDTFLGTWYLRPVMLRARRWEVVKINRSRISCRLIDKSGVEHTRWARGNGIASFPAALIDFATIERNGVPVPLAPKTAIDHTVDGAR